MILIPHELQSRSRRSFEDAATRKDNKNSIFSLALADRIRQWLLIPDYPSSGNAWGRLADLKY